MYVLMSRLANWGRRFVFRSVLSCVLPVLAATGPVTGKPLDTSLLRVSGPQGVAGGLDEILPDGPVILHFWATWCAPCRAELPEVAAFKTVLEKAGLGDRLVLISVDSRPYDEIEAFLHDELGLKELQSLQADSRMTGAVFRLTGYPGTVWLDDGHEETGRHAGALQWSTEAVQTELIGNALTRMP